MAPVKAGTCFPGETSDGAARTRRLRITMLLSMTFKYFP
jgi:hypothetical protein